MPAQRNRFQKDAPKPLRSTTAPVEFTPYQLLALGSFISAMLSEGHGCYANLLTTSGTVRVRLYVDGDVWEDNISPRDDFAAILGDYAKQFGITGAYTRVLAAGHAGSAARAAEPSRPAPEGDDTAPGGAKRLRAS